MRRVVLSCLSLAACAEHMTIGALDQDGSVDCPDATLLDAAALDAGSSDATLRGEGSVVVAPLLASLYAFGQHDIYSATGLCNAECADFELRTSGGTPPYKVMWGDGRTGVTRTVCPGDSLMDPAASFTALITDTSPTPQTNLFRGPLGSQSGCVDGGVPNWRACISAGNAPDFVCNSGTWYSLREPVRAARVELSAFVSPWSVDPIQLDILAASEPCGPTRFVTSAGVLSSSIPQVSGTIDASSEPVQYIVVRVGGMPIPEQLFVSMGVCFSP